MKKIKTLLLVSMLSITAIGAASCQKKGNDGIQEITFVEEYDIPSIKLGIEYDFEPYFTKQNGVEYTMTAMYLDDDLNEVYLDVDGFKFTQNEFSDVFVTITATKGNETRSGEVQIPVDMRYDKTDHWVVDSLFSGTGMTKKLNYLPQYRTSLDSLTSVRFAYKGSAAKNSPISAIPFIDWPSNSRLTVGDWSNAVITFDVYNSSADNIIFGFIMKHSSGISYSFDQCEKFVCEPNQWTHIEYSLKSLNYTEPFVFNSEYDLSDMIIAQTIYEGATEGSLYSYNFYVDNVDICDYSEEKFPNLDTTTYKEYEDFFTKDDALSAIVNDDYENAQKTNALYNYEELTEYSNKSLKMVLSEDGSAAHGFLHSFIGGNPTGWKPLDITDATMSFYIRPVNVDNIFVLKFESDDNVFGNAIEIDLTKESGQGWTVASQEDGWYKVTVDVDQTNTETALVRTDFIRTMRLYFTNNTAESGKESAVYLDTLILENYKTTGVYGEDAELTWETKSPYTSQEEQDMFSHDDNLVLTVNGEILENDLAQDIHERSEKSNYSYKMTLPVGETPSWAVVDSFFTGTPSDWTILDMSEATVTFDVKCVNADSVVKVAFASDFDHRGLLLGSKVVIDLTQASGEGWTVIALENGWYRIALDMKTAKIEDEVLGVTKDFLKIMRVEFTNASAQAESESAVYVDNLGVAGAKPTETELDEEKPWDTKSPYINYTVTFVNSDGSIISQNTYHYGDVVDVPNAPSMENMEHEGTFEFNGWDYEVTTVNCDATYKATYVGTVSDLINSTMNQNTLELSYDTETKSANSNRSLKVTSPWTETENTFPFFELAFNQNYDLSNKYVVFDLNKGNYDGWFAFDFVNGDVKLGLWTVLSINADSKETTHKCEDLGNGWLRVYVNASVLAGEKEISSVNKLYLTIHSTKAGASGNLEFYLDNLHFEDIPQVTKYTITFKDYDGREISKAEYEEGATVTVPGNPTRAAVAGESEYIFTGWDYEVTTANCDATYTAVYAVSNIIDLFNCKIENGGIDTITNDSEVKSENSTYSLRLVEPITSGNLPYVAIELDKSYDLSGKYIVFDFKDIDKTGWLVAFDFVNNGGKLGLWHIHVLDNGVSSDTHKCEDLGNGWLRVYVDASALSASVDNVSKIYMTFNAADGSGTLTLNFDNLHFEDIPQIPQVTKYTITFKDYDGRVISSEEYEEGATVTVPENPTRAAVVGESEYIFTGWDYEVTTANCDATYTAVYAVSNIIDLFNCKIENGGIDTITNDSEVKSENSTYSLRLVEPITSGNLPYIAIELDKSYDLSGKYIVFDFKDIDKTGWLVAFDFVNNGGKLNLWNMHALDNGASSASYKCEDLGNGWLRVYVDADALKDSLNNVSKIYMTFNASDGNGTLTLNFDNLHFEDKSTETQA